jgi:hypothetical protein
LIYFIQEVVSKAKFHRVAERPDVFVANKKILDVDPINATITFKIQSLNNVLLRQPLLNQSVKKIKPH